LTIQIVNAGQIGDGAVLEGFMRRMRATDDLTLVHLVEPINHETLNNEVADGLVDDVRAVDEALRKRFPAMRAVESCVLIDLGRTWSDQARQAAARLLEVAADTRIGAILAVTGSTAASVAGDRADRAGILADTAWALTAGALTGLHGFTDHVRVWAVASNSFTVDTSAWALLSTTGVVAEAVDRGPLFRPSEGILDGADKKGAQWVADRSIGTSGERDLIRSGFAGDSRGLLDISQEPILAVQPQDWATAADREFMRVAGAPLRRFTQIVRGNAEALAIGHEDARGHVHSLDDALTAELRLHAGCLRAGRFVNGAANALSEAVRQVANEPRTDPSDVPVDRGRKDLERAVSALAEVRPWSVRVALVALLMLVMTQALALPIALLAAPAVVGLLWLWNRRARNRAVEARNKYVELIQSRIRALADQRLFEAQLELIKRVQAHLGAFLDDRDVMVIMEVAETPPENTRAADVMRIWRDLREVRALFQTPDHTFESIQPIPPSGQFFLTYPRDVADANDIASLTSEVAKRGREQVRKACTEELGEVELSWHRSDFVARLQAVCRQEAAVPEGLFAVEEIRKDVMRDVVATLRSRNAPQLDHDQHAREACVVLAPEQDLPPLLEDVLTVDRGVLRVATADPRRISVVWLVQQSFEEPHSPALTPMPVAEQLEPSDPPVPPGMGFVEEGV
jgi:hypothetical protein